MGKGVGGLMRGRKIPTQDIALKMQRGLMCEGGGAYLRDTTVQECTQHTIKQYMTGTQIFIESEWGVYFK